MSLTNEQLIELYQKTSDDRFFNQLYKQNEGLIKSIVFKYNQNNMIDFSYDDIISQANIGFLKAVRGFDTSRNVKFSTLATTVIKREIQRVNIDNSRQKRYCKFDIVPLHSKLKSGDSHTFEEVVSYEHDIFKCDKDVYELDDYKELCNKLSKEQLKVFNMLLAGYTQKDISKITNKTHQNVSLRVKMIREKAREIGLMG